MSEQKTHSTGDQNNEKCIHDFEFKDARGRHMGCVIDKFTREYVPSERDANPYCRMPPGVYFCFRPHATRNGQDYGAGQSDQCFKTEAERAAAIGKYLHGAYNRAAKQATPS